ncbi:RNA-directed DNA polymerase, eukaryota [Tanacetum coccineum]
MGDHNRNFHYSNEGQTSEISKFIFLTYFRVDSTAKDLWRVCNNYGTVVDVFIPFKKSKAGKCFAFVRFIKVINLDRLVENLCTVWMGRFHLHANVVRYQRPHKPKVFIPREQPFPGTAKGSFASVLKEEHKAKDAIANNKPALVLDDSCLRDFDFSASIMGPVKDLPLSPTIVWVSIEGLPIYVWTSNSFHKIASLWGEQMELEECDSNSLSCKLLCLKIKSDVFINERRKILIKGKVYWIYAKEKKPWVPIFLDDTTDESSDNESQDEGSEVKLSNDEAKGLSEVDKVSESSFMQVNVPAQENPNNSNIGEVESHSKDPFNIYGILNGNHKHESKVTKDEPEFPPGCFTPVNKEGDFSEEDCSHVVLDQVQSLSNKCWWINPRSNGRIGKSRPNHGLYVREILRQLLAHKEITMCLDEFLSLNVQGLGNKPKKGWIEELCHKHRVNFVSIQETKMESIDLFSINALWGNWNFDFAFSPSVGSSGGIVCVWDQSKFIKEHISKTDYFVALMGSWSPTSTKLLVISIYAPQEYSKKRDLWNYLRTLIDRWEGETIIMGDFNEVRFEYERFEGLLSNFPHLSALCLDKHLSDHRPILLRESCFDYGPTPFRFFHLWFSLEGFDKFVENTWKSTTVDEPNSLVRLKKKLQLLKSAIKVWTKEARVRLHKKKNTIRHNLSLVDKLIDQGKSTTEVLNSRCNLMKELQELSSLEASDISQKAKIRWSIEGDENTKYFHGVLNKKRSQLAIRGTLANGDWISDPDSVKFEFYSHFKQQFYSHQTPRIEFGFSFPNRWSSDQIEDLERNVTYEEVKRAVWDCGVNKSPAVSEFFASGHIPKGCNSSILALIPKIQNVNLVKDFRPIGLIRSIYKIITKILANRLVHVIPCLISEVQSAFVSNRQILDGPFILNELLSWCKLKKKSAMIFKIDFEKAFDSVKWVYLLDSLKAFGFGQKWCNWIKGCLESAMGSVLVNGCPTSEFQFYKGLKQGDPISPFLFILVMETIHLSFQRVIDASLYRGISLSDSFMISHLFYADDVVFIGEWNASNIKTITNVLNCFFLAYGLKINIHKSKLMGVGVKPVKVDIAAAQVGCGTFSSPFKNLGVKVGGNMSRINSWEDVITKVSNRLSKWKLKTLSIVPMGVIKKLEVIRQNFFNGIECSDKKITWISWEKILASKRYGGLGVSSFFASNRGLLFKWVWRFFTDDKSWWAHFIIAIHGKQGAIGSSNSKSRRSIWLDIIHDLNSLKTKVAEKLHFPSMVHSFRRLPRGGVEEAQLVSLHSRLASVSLSNMSDRWFWSLDVSGSFSVKSTGNFIDEIFLPKADVPSRWVKVIPAKVNIYAWRVFLDKLPTRINLSIRGIEIPSILCPICNSSVESTSHIFFSCPMARLLWSKVFRWWEIDDSIFQNYNNWLYWLVNIRLPKHLKIFLEGLCYILWWTIRRFRNQLLFGAKTPCRGLLFDEVVQMSFTWCSNRYLTLYEAKGGEGRLRVLVVAAIAVASCKSGGGGVVKGVKAKGVFGNEFKSAPWHRKGLAKRREAWPPRQAIDQCLGLRLDNNNASSKNTRYGRIPLALQEEQEIAGYRFARKKRFQTCEGKPDSKQSPHKILTLWGKDFVPRSRKKKEESFGQ